jgi:hypothetical protein
MHPSTQRVLSLLKKKKNKGVTFHDFGTGFRLGARIKDLRDTGLTIVTHKEPLPSGNWHGRYVLIKEEA